MNDSGGDVLQQRETDQPEAPLMTVEEFMQLKIPHNLDQVMKENGIQTNMDGEIFAYDRNILNFLGRAGVSVSVWWEKDRNTGGIQPKADSHRLIRSTANLLVRLYWLSVMREKGFFSDCDASDWKHMLDTECSWVQERFLLRRREVGATGESDSQATSSADVDKEEIKRRILAAFLPHEGTSSRAY